MLKKLLLLPLCLYSISAYASIVVVGTRVIYPENNKSIGVELQNFNHVPSLVQVWMDDGDKKNTQVPFTIKNPVNRIDPKHSQTISISYTGKDIAKDRESLYYINVLDTSPKQKTNNAKENEAKLNFTIVNRLKFFYRPDKLPYPVTKAYEKVTWHIQNKTLTVKNPTPYYITYSDVSLMQNQSNVVKVNKVGMLAPFSEKSYELSQPTPQANQVSWHIINDYGGDYGNVSPLQR